MEKNTKGRVIHTGPRGGRYVMENGRKIYKFKVATRSATPPIMNLNTKGRVIHTGPRGGRYVMEKGRKIYKFKVATVPRVARTPIKLPERVKDKLLKLAANVKRRRISPTTRNFFTDSVKLKFKSFDTVDPTKAMVTSDVELTIKTPSNVKSQLGNLIKNGTVLGVTKDTLPTQAWLDAQARYLSSLNNYDLYTAMSYTVRSHQWIGPWLRGEMYDFTKPQGHTLPLYSQIMKIANSAKHKSEWARKLVESRYPYQVYRDILPLGIPNDIMQHALKLYTKDLQRIIRNAPPLPKTIYVYRGLFTDIMKNRIGTQHTLGEFASTGYVPQRGYASDNYIRFKLLKGTRVLLLQGLNQWNDSGEHEIVLNKGAHYVIKKRYLQRYAYNVADPTWWYKKQNKVTDVTVFSS